MDTDFEEECKDIVTRRKKLTEELKKANKARTMVAAASNSTHTAPDAVAATKRIVRKKPKRR